MVKEESTRSVVKRLRAAGFTRTSTDGRHSKWSHPTGVWVPVPDSHRMISAGVIRRINKAIDESRDKVMYEYSVEVTRDGRWWMIHVPEIAQLTQARRIGEIVPMAQSLIAISTDRRLSEITVHITRIDVPGLGDIAARAAAIAAARDAAMHATAAAQRETAEYARALAEAGVPVRDTADLLHVSPQRVSQLANR